MDIVPTSNQAFNTQGNCPFVMRYSCVVARGRKIWLIAERRLSDTDR